MGGTLPAVARALVSARESVGRKVGVLYAMNTFGAAAGALLSGYWLIPAYGIKITNWLGVAASLFSGIAVLLLFREPPAEPATWVEQETPAACNKPALESVLLWGFAASGAVAMLYQIVWTRALVLVIGNSTYAFSAILVVFLGGLGGGSYLFSRLPWANKAWFFSVLQVGIGLSAYLLVIFFDLLPVVFLALFSGYEGEYAYVLLIQLLITAMVLIIPTTLMGMTLPCVMGALCGDNREFGGSLGKYYAFNTMGAIVGSIVAGFLLVPTIGANKTLVLGVAVNILTAVAVAWYTFANKRIVFVLGVLGTLGVGLAIAAPSWSRHIMLSGVSIYSSKYLSKAKDVGFSDLLSERIFEILYFREGISTTTAVLMNNTGHKSLVLNGKIDGSSGFDMETQIRIALVPMHLHADPKNVGIVGLGTGTTAGVAALFAEPERIDVVEIEPSVVEAARFFEDENMNVLEDPRVRLHFDDARSFFQSTRTEYDVVISEPSNPWIAGIANLFTLEHFSAVRQKLAPGGVFAQWMHGYSITPDDFKMVARTFMSVFPEATLWATSRSDYLLVGRLDGGRSPSINTVSEHALHSPLLAQSFTGDKISPLGAVASIFILDTEELKIFAGDGPINSDDLPLLEFSAPRALYLNLDSVLISEMLKLKRSMLPAFLNAPKLEETRTHILLGEYLRRHKFWEMATWHFERAPSMAPVVAPEWDLGRMPDRESAALPKDGVFETFDADPILSFFPQVGLYRMEDADGSDMPSWKAALANFTRVAGIQEGVGMGGRGKALALRSVSNIDVAAYYARIPVESTSEYEISLWIRTGRDLKAAVGVDVLEFDVWRGGLSQPTRTFLDDHYTQASEGVHAMAVNGWRKYSFTFKTSPDSVMAHVMLYVRGEQSPKSVLFDDISIRQLP